MKKTSEYRRLAEECRLLAETMSHGAQGVMLAVAAVWDQLAEDHAEHAQAGNGDGPGLVPDLEAPRATAKPIIVDGAKRDPERVYDVIVNIALSLAQSGRCSVEEVSAAIEELLAKLEAHGQPRR